MGQSGHNLKIAKYRHGCRLPCESAGDGYAASGPVVTYRMSPEEIAARYGPPAKRKERLPYEQYIRELAQKLPEDELREMIAQGMSDGEIAQAKGLRWHHVRKLRDYYKIREVETMIAQSNDDVYFEDKAEEVRVDGYKIKFSRKDVEAALDSGSVNAAKDILGCSVGALYAHMKHYDLKAPGKRDAEPEPEQKSEQKPGCERITIKQAIKLREEMQAEVEYAKKLLINYGLTPRLKDLVTNFGEQCQGKVERINKAFEQEIEV